MKVCAVQQHVKDVDSEQRSSVTASFLLRSQRTARETDWTQPHWPGWIEEKGWRQDRKKGKKGRVQEMGSVSFMQHYNLGRWIASVASSGSFLLNAIYTHNLTIKYGANRGDLAPTVISLWCIWVSASFSFYTSLIHRSDWLRKTLLLYHKSTHTSACAHKYTLTTAKHEHTRGRISGFR